MSVSDRHRSHRIDRTVPKQGIILSAATAVAGTSSFQSGQYPATTTLEPSRVATQDIERRTVHRGEPRAVQAADLGVRPEPASCVVPHRFSCVVPHRFYRGGLVRHYGGRFSNLRLKQAISLSWQCVASACCCIEPQKNPPMAGSQGWLAAVRNGGLGRNRTGVRGFAGRCMTTLPPGHCLVHHDLMIVDLSKNKTPVSRGFA